MRYIFFERSDSLGLEACTYKEITELQGAWLDRYRNDAKFRVRVMSIVHQLLQAL